MRRKPVKVLYIQTKNIQGHCCLQFLGVSTLILFFMPHENCTWDTYLIMVCQPSSAHCGASLDIIEPSDTVCLGFVYISDRLPTTSAGASSRTGWRTSSRAGAEAVNLLSGWRKDVLVVENEVEMRLKMRGAPAYELVSQPVRELAPALVVGNRSLM